MSHFWVTLDDILAQVQLKKKEKKNTDNFWFLFEHFWECFWGLFWDQIGHSGAKMTPREPSGASKNQIAAFSKVLKKQQFFSVLGSRGFPRERQEAGVASQETPKETPKGGPKLGKKTGQKVNPKLSKKRHFFDVKLSLWPVALGVCFRPCGLLKTFTSKMYSRFQKIA